MGKKYTLNRPPVGEWATDGRETDRDREGDRERQTQRVRERERESQERQRERAERERDRERVKREREGKERRTGGVKNRNAKVSTALEVAHALTTDLCVLSEAVIERRGEGQTM
jgi:hypothetical protein